MTKSTSSLEKTLRDEDIDAITKRVIEMIGAKLSAPALPVTPEAGPPAPPVAAPRSSPQKLSFTRYLLRDILRAVRVARAPQPFRVMMGSAGRRGGRQRGGDLVLLVTFEVLAPIVSDCHRRSATACA